MDVWLLRTTEGATWPLRRFPARVGREGARGLVVGLTDPRVSRQHAEIDVDDEGRLVVRDLSSRNGTLLNGSVVRRKQRLTTGDTIRIGSTDLTLERAQIDLETARCDLEEAAEAFGEVTRSISYDLIAQSAVDKGRAAGTAHRPEHARVGLLYELGHRVAGLRDPAEIVDAVTGIVADLLGAERAAIYEPCEGGLRWLAGVEEGRAAQLQPQGGATETVIWRALNLRQAIIHDGRRGAEEACSASVVDLEIRSAIAVPLCVGDRTTGVLYADTRRDEHPLSDVALELLGAIGMQAAASLEAARQHESVEEARRELADANQRLRQWGVELEKRVHERTEEIERQKGEIEELLANKNDLLRMVAHDLRMPLSNIVGYCQIAEHDFDIGDYATLPERLRTISSVGRRMAYMLDDLLTAESIGTGRLKVRRGSVAIGGLLQASLETMSLLAGEHRVSLNLQVPEGIPHAQIDPDRVTQVIDNLLTNAIKAATNGGEVSLRARRNGAFLVVEVTDDGPGMAPAAGGRAGVGRGQGFGLGISIARKLARLMGGAIEFESEPGRGTTASLVVPEAFEAVRSVPLPEGRDRHEAAPRDRQQRAG